MRFSPRTWFLLSIMLFIAAAFFWMKGDELEERRRINREAKPNAVNPSPGGHAVAGNTQALNLLSTKSGTTPLAQLNNAASQVTPDTEKLHPFRLRNTSLPLETLAQRDSGLLLANALIDTREGKGLEIPQHLKADSDPMSYIVQWNGPVNNAFRELLANAKAEIVSYVPNNAYLVKATADQVNNLKGAPGVQSVTAYEPYFKFDTRLLALAVKNEALPENALLRLTLFPNEAASGIENVEKLNGEVLAQETSPFGPQLVIRPNQDSLAALAKLPMVQAIEPDIIRTPAADLTRVRVGVSDDTITNANYLGLTGTNIWINMNDVAVDTNHPALTGRVFTPDARFARDTNGHGTFVAALLAGSGGGSISTNIPGAVSNTNYRGIAPGANLLMLPISSTPAVYPKVLDTYLIETAALANYITLGRTNAMISNNSWVYSGASEYDSSAARYDAAVRDALLDRTGEQPLLFVFAAGNGGFGSDNGLDGEPGSIFSPGTAKNVITVGALESARFITNSYYVTNIDVDIDGNPSTNVVTNTPFLGMTDSNFEVASYSSRGNVGAGREGVFGRFKPDVVAPGTFLVSARSSDWKPETVYDTNTPVGRLAVELNEDLEDYRFDSGTTFATPVISGMAALIEEFFRSKATDVLEHSPSPALMKAMIINSARSANEQYSLQINSLINYQGWGLPNLRRAISTNFTLGNEARWTSRLIDQSPENALATGESRTWNISLTTNSMAYPLRVTLVWTDPPGNPQAGIKLVNDLDLVVTNLESGLVIYGNDIPTRSDFNAVHDPAIEGFVAPRDFVNNVENIIISNPRSLGTNFSITVQARKVNVNAVHDFLAVTSKTNDVVQDFALVISSDIDVPEADVFTGFTEPTHSVALPPETLQVITNGLPLLNERVGANATLVGTNGVTNQWRFYVFTNTYIPNSLLSLTNGTNMAFVTFTPPNLAQARNLEADIDLYVSTDSRLTNLHPAAIAGALKSTERGGTEVVAMTNAVIDEVYYVGVKSEDQQAGEYSLMGVSSDLPFEQDIGGKKLLMGVPFSVFLPDGSPNQPSANTTIAIGLSNKRVLRTVVTNIVSHENFGDLVGILRHSGATATLNNHINTNGFQTNVLIFDDTRLLPPEPNSRRSDGPGTLRNFNGQKIVGPWIFQMIDNAPSHTGRVEVVSLMIDPLQDDLLPGVTISGTVGDTPLVYPINVPAGVTNMLIRLNPKAPGGFIEVALRRDEIPTLTERDIAFTNTSLTGPISFEYGLTNSPPLQPGNYYLSVRRLFPFPATIDFDLLMLFEYGTAPDSFADIVGGGLDVNDDAITNSTVFVRSDKTITKAAVSLHLTHPRVSDLAVSLVSPQGTKILLTENRGRDNNSGFGRFYTLTNGSNVVTETAYAVFTDDLNLAELPIKFAEPPYADFSTNVGKVYTNGFEAATNGSYAITQTFDGWTVTSNRVSVLNTYDAPEGTNFMVVTGGAASHTLPTIKGRSYRLTLRYKAGEELGLFSTGVSGDHLLMTNRSLDPHYFVIKSADSTTPGPETFVAPDRFPANGLINSQWITPNPETGNAAGDYIYRTYFSMFGRSLINASITGSIATDNSTTNVLLNGTPTTVQSLGPNASNVNITTGFLPGVNTLDFVVRNSGSYVGLQAQLRLNAATNSAIDMADSGFAVIGLEDNGTNSVVGGPQWKIAEIEFVAQQDDTELTIHSGFPGIWIDDIVLVDTGIKYYLPEEPLELLNGERALGEWRLEIWDTRLGAVVNDALLEWELNLDYADPAFFAEPLSFGTTYPTTIVRTNQPTGVIPGTIRRAEEQYFVVDTCADTTELSVTLRGVNGNVGRVELLASYGGFPTGDPEKDTYPILRNDQVVNGNNGLVTLTLTTNSPISSPLRPGQPLFLAVRNRSVTRTNSFEITLTGNGICTPISTIRTLTSGNTVQSSLAANEEAEVFSFTVSSAQMETATIEVEANADVGVVISKGTIPEENNFQFKSDAAGSGNETIVLNRNSLPQPLSPGEYLIRVYKKTTGPVNYSITATESVGSSGPTPLPTDATVTTTLQPRGGEQTTYRITVPDDVTAVLFEIYNLSGNADLWVKQGSVPTLTDNYRISANPGTTPEQIVLRENGSLPDLDGDWYVVVANNESTPTQVTFNVTHKRVGTLPDDGTLQSGAPIQVSVTKVAGALRLSWNSVQGEVYQVLTSTNLQDWTTAGTVNATGAVSVFNAQNLGENARFFRVRQMPQ